MKSKETIKIKCPWLVAEGDGTAKVVRWLVGENEAIEIDQDIMIMLLKEEEFVLPSPVDGSVLSLLVEPGDLIEPDQVLAIIKLE